MGTVSLIIILVSGVVGVFGPIIFAAFELRRGESSQYHEFQVSRNADSGTSKAKPESERQYQHETEVTSMGRKIIGIILTVVGCLGFLMGLPMLFRGISMMSSSPSGDLERYVATRELSGGLFACVLFGVTLVAGIWLLRKDRRLNPTSNKE